MSNPPKHIDTDRVIETNLFIDGESKHASNNANYRLFNPARPDEFVGQAASATVQDVDNAVCAAHQAYPNWAALTYAERAIYLIKIADALSADEDDIAYRARLLCREHGKVLNEAMLELTRLSDRFRLVAAYAERLGKDEKIPGPPFDTIVTRQPRGVALLIVPWNWPLSILSMKLPQALLAGNTVVVKPAESASLAPSLTIQLIASELPPGVVNLITGTSLNIGDALLSHRLVRYINFTGSVAVGKHIMRMAAGNLTPVTLELGGNDPALVFKDADLDAAAFKRLYLAAFMTTGQICMAMKRLYVHRSRYDEVIDGLLDVCENVVVGDGLLPATDMGPLNNSKQLAVVSSMIDEARSAGASVRECGRVPDEALYARGYFQKPVLIFDPDPELRIVREEQFGPVLPIIPFNTDAEAVSMANDSNLGLCSSVWTSDRDHALRVARQLEAGYTFLNGHGPMAQDSRAPFGGFKDSGMGRNLGYEGIVQFQGYHSISGTGGWLL